MSGRKNSSDLEALASEACDLWQEHLAAYANDAKARAELMRVLAPSRKLFAEWATLMQHGAYGAEFSGKENGSGGRSGPAARPDGDDDPAENNAAPDRTAPAGPASRGNAVDLAQFADRLERLEERLARLESGSEKPARKSARSSRFKS